MYLIFLWTVTAQIYSKWIIYIFWYYSVTERRIAFIPTCVRSSFVALWICWLIDQRSLLAAATTFIAITEQRHSLDLHDLSFFHFYFNEWRWAALWKAGWSARMIFLFILFIIFLYVFFWFFFYFPFIFTNFLFLYYFIFYFSFPSTFFLSSFVLVKLYMSSFNTLFLI